MPVCILLSTATVTHQEETLGEGEDGPRHSLCSQEHTHSRVSPHCAGLQSVWMSCSGTLEGVSMCPDGAISGSEITLTYRLESLEKEK